MKYIVDVSGYNGRVNWAAIKKKKITGAIIKIIRKDLEPDKQFKNNYNGVIKNEMPWGVFNYSYATNTKKAVSDMTLVCDMLDELDTSRMKYGVWLDVEDKTIAALQEATIAEIINAAQKTVEGRGYVFGVYTGKAFFEEHIDAAKISCENWWIARYYAGRAPFDYAQAPDTKYKPTQPAGIVAWQYTSCCRAAGLMDGENCDQSVLYKDPAARETSTDAIKKLIKIAEDEVGYLEKKSDSKLDSKTANAGSGNWNKYARDLQSWTGEKKIYPNAQPWCDMFVDWCMVKAFGAAKAKQLLGGWSAYTPTSAAYYKRANRWHTIPQVGDQIFFKNDQRICHTGIVYKIDQAKVYTIEGNTSGASGVIANGGGVCKKSYSLAYHRIDGYGRPDYMLVGKKTVVNEIGKISPEIKTTLQLAVEVMQGKHGTGAARVKALGSRYAEVQSFINYVAVAKTTELAKEVIAGKYGDGDTRKTILGRRYDAVQRRVNQIKK